MSNGEGQNSSSGNANNNCGLCMEKIKAEIHNAVEDALSVRGLNEDDRKEILMDMVWTRKARENSDNIGNWTKKAIIGALVLTALGAMWFGIKAAILALLGK